jgi:GTPase Era involved in 16S rRNA processing
MSASSKRKIAILEQPGAGKSSLLNLLTEGRCIPKPLIGPQTDQTDWSVNANITLSHTYENLLFVDAPGYNTVTHPVNTFATQFPFQVFDRVIVVVSGKILEADEKVWRALTSKKATKDILVVRTFSESLEESEQQEILLDLRRKFGMNVIFVSNRTKSGLDTVFRHIC